MNRGSVLLELGDPRIPQLLRAAGALVLGNTGDGGHVCSRERCAPRPPCLGYNLYLCSAGMLHVCSADSCKLWQWDVQGQTCPISGVQYGAITSEYVKDDPRTWAGSSAPPPRTPKPSPQLAQALASEHIRDRASAVVKQLLYSSARVECNRATLAANIARGREVCARYDENQLANRQPSYWTDRYRLMGKWGSEPLPFRIYVFDQALHDYYVRIIVQVWKKVDRYYVAAGGADTHLPPLRADIDCIATAVMYYMRHGLVYRGVRLLPKDDFIVLNLPYVNQLHHFAILKSNITDGEKIIERTFELAINNGVPEHELALAPEQLVRVVDDDDDDDRDERDDLVLDGNGERLFKLPSTKKRRSDP